MDVVDDQKDSFSTSCWKDGGIDFVILPEADDDDEGEVEGDDVEDDTGRSHHPYGDGRDGLIAVGTKKRAERRQRSRDRVVKDRRPWHSRESEDEDVCVSTTTQKDGCWHVHDVVSSLGFDVSTSKDCDGTILRTVVDVGRLVSEVQFWGRWIDATRYCVCAGRDDLCASFVSLVRPRTSIVGTIVVGVVSRKKNRRCVFVVVVRVGRSSSYPTHVRLHRRIFVVVLSRRDDERRSFDGRTPVERLVPSMHLSGGH